MASLVLPGATPSSGELRYIQGLRTTAVACLGGNLAADEVVPKKLIR
jgi:hypothetical protein